MEFICRRGGGALVGNRRVHCVFFRDAVSFHMGEWKIWGIEFWKPSIPKCPKRS